MGVHISSRGLAPNPELITTLTSLSPPSDRSDLRRFLGLCQGLVAFNFRLHSQLSPLRPFLDASPDVFATARFTNVWASVVAQVSSSLWRVQPFYPKACSVFQIFVDSSPLGHGGGLIQNAIFIAMWSCQNAQSFRSSNHAELAGFVRCVEAFLPYICLSPFHVFTDNVSVIQAFDPANTSSFALRHLAKLQDMCVWPVSLQHIAGQENVLADILSRSRYLAQRKNQRQEVVQVVEPKGDLSEQ